LSLNSGQSSVQSVFRDPISAATQLSTQPIRRDSETVFLAPQPPSQAIHRNSLSVVPQRPASVYRATDPLFIAVPPSQSPLRRAPESPPRDRGILVSTRVRFNDENLICPSPIPMHERRKGWHNRRGCVCLSQLFFVLTAMVVDADPSSFFLILALRDQLWTNKGDYKPAPQGQEYPPDLANYPEYGEGWMNEEGVRIDMQHRLIPKPPLRSALKRPRQMSNAGPGANPPPFIPVAGARP